MFSQRAELQHDWEQGDYVEGGVLEDRIDWNKLAEMEEQTMRILRKTLDEHDKIVAHYSGGLDINVVVHLLSRLDHDTDVMLLNYRTIEQYPATVEFVQGMFDAYDFPHEEFVTEHRDMEWVKENPDVRLFPRWEKKDELYNESYRFAAHDYHQEHDVDAFITGRRHEHCVTKTRICTDKEAYDMSPRYPDLDEMTCWQINAIEPWGIEHVVAYLDKYNIPMMPSYHHYSAGPEVPWHRHESGNWSHDFSDEQMWHTVRKLTVRYGYTDFWDDYILNHFPEGEEMAQAHAASEDECLITIEEGYEHGADAQPVPYPIGPVSDGESE